MVDTISEEQGRLLLKMARTSIGRKLGLSANETMEEDRPWDSGFLDQKRGLFVTLHKAGKLRGCIGNIEPVKILARGICDNAVSAAFDDNRFAPLSVDEFSLVDIEVSLLSLPEKLEYTDGNDLQTKLVPHRDGVIVEKGGRRATFLPQVWDQLPSSQEFLRHLCTKAGLASNAWEKEGVSVYIYQVQAFGEMS